ncbi:MAG: protease modulator HflK, partial [Acidobacteriia bacterium]|nr:protease modulator HflK [Methyloceanibacter sp.]MCL6491266.1 protease modulator HflK [Terriglobia bacterium]
ANTDAERMRNEAEAYRNDIVPRARGDAARIVAEAQGEKEAAIAIATGRAQRFTSVLAAYEATKEVTMQRLYLETMEQLLQHAPTLIVDEKLKGVLPLLPIPPLELKPPAEAKPPASAASPAAPAAKASP